MTPAEELTNRTFFRTVNLWALIRQFRKVAGHGRPLARQTIHGEALAQVSSPRFRRFIRDDVQVTDELLVQMAERMVAKTIENADSVVNAGLLTYPQSFLQRRSLEVEA